MSRKLTVFVFLLLLWTSACSPASIFSLTPTPTAYIYPTAITPNVPALTVDSLKNAEYTLPGFDNAQYAYKFTDGKFTRGSDASAADYASLNILDFYAFGDLDDDGVNDAAVIISENHGGTAVLLSVNAVLNDNGQPRPMASTMIDDRAQINALDIRDGKIYLDAVVHGASDPACCPSQGVTRSFALNGTSLMLVHATSRLSNGQEREILIDSPSDDAELSGELLIGGRVTIAPFENTLVYHVYNAQGNELSSGPIMVISPDIGQPGTFETSLDTSTYAPGHIRIVVADLNSAYGSVLALDSVMVVIQ